jgi:ABC-2 type transport system permease protein
MVARDLRYWWRDAKRRANLVTVAVIGVLAPLIVAGGGVRLMFQPDGAGPGAASASTPLAVHLTMVFVGAFAASVLANQFGVDGTAYAAHVIAGGPGRRELLSRAVAHALLMAPLLLLVGAVMGVMVGEPGAAFAAWGLAAAGYGTGVAINQYLAVLAPYPLPEGSNPFATASGTGLAKSLLALVAIVIAYAVTAPVLVLAAWLGPVWPWLALPVGAGYGVAAVALATYLAGDVLDHRSPELLAAINPATRAGP